MITSQRIVDSNDRRYYPAQEDCTTITMPRRKTMNQRRRSALLPVAVLPDICFWLSRRQHSVLLCLFATVYVWTVSSADDADHYYDNNDDEEEDDDTDAGYATLILYGLLLSIMGWIAIFYPFVFVPKFVSTLEQFNRTGIVCEGRIIQSRKGRVFNPIRWLLPARYNCYVTVEFANPTANGMLVRKEICVHEESYKHLLRKSSIAASWSIEEHQQQQQEGKTADHTPITTTTTTMTAAAAAAISSTTATRGSRGRGTIVTVYTLPEYPRSGCLDASVQGVRLSTQSQILYGSASALLLAIGIWTSIVIPTKANGMFASPGWWKFWVVLLGHVVSAALAYWGCNFVYRNRVEEVLYEVGEDDVPAVTTEERRSDGGKREVAPGQKTTAGAPLGGGGGSPAVNKKTGVVELAEVKSTPPSTEGVSEYYALE